MKEAKTNFAVIAITCTICECMRMQLFSSTFNSYQSVDFSIIRTYGDLQRPIMCKLCATEILNAALLRVHLLSNLHKEREKSICYSSERQQSVQ